VLSSVAAGVVVLDAELRVRSWNRGAEELWGLRSAEVNQQGYFTLEFGLPGTLVWDIVQRCVESGNRSGPMDVKAVNRIGRTITCSVACSPLDGHPRGVVLLMEESR
jgi:two-component system CheB/CheR fusion protein